MKPSPAPARPSNNDGRQRLVATKTTATQGVVKRGTSPVGDVPEDKRPREEDKEDKEDNGDEGSADEKEEGSPEEITTNNIHAALSRTEDISELNIEVIAGSISATMFGSDQRRTTFWLVLKFTERAKASLTGTFLISGLNVAGYDKEYLFRATCRGGIPPHSPSLAIKVMFGPSGSGYKNLKITDFNPRQNIRSAKRQKSIVDIKVCEDVEDEKSERNDISQEVLRNEALKLISAEDDDVVIGAITNLKNRYKEQVESRFRERVQPQLELQLKQTIEDEITKEFTPAIRTSIEARIRREIESRLRPMVEEEIRSDVDFRFKIESDIRATIEEEQRAIYKKKMDMIDRILDQ